MSYNIDTFKLKKLEKLSIPIQPFYDEELYKKERLDNSYIPDKPEIDILTDKIKIEGGAEGFELFGKKNGLNVDVEKITIYGEGSGRFFDILKIALQQSTGQLEAVLVWEGGETVSRLKVDNGKVTDEDADL